MLINSSDDWLIDWFYLMCEREFSMNDSSFAISRRWWSNENSFSKDYYWMLKEIDQMQSNILLKEKIINSCSYLYIMRKNMHINQTYISSSDEKRCGIIKAAVDNTISRSANFPTLYRNTSPHVNLYIARRHHNNFSLFEEMIQSSQ